MVLFTSRSTAVHGTCDEEWTEYNNKCYKPITASMERPGYMFFDEAENVCAGFEAGLPSIHSYEDEIFLASQLRVIQQSASATGLWLGGRITSVDDLTPIWTNNSPGNFKNFNTNSIDYGYFRVFPTYRCIVYVDPQFVSGGGNWDIGNCVNSGTEYGVVCAKNAN